MASAEGFIGAPVALLFSPPFPDRRPSPQRFF